MNSLSSRRTGPPGFDFTLAMRRLTEDAVRRVPELAHIDLSRVAVSFARARHREVYGMQASLTPLRFQNGAATTTRRGRKYAVQKVCDGSGQEMLYILTFYLPRFLDLPFREKLVTLFHELWHIGPHFDGDLRRHEGRCYAHSHSQREYDERMGAMADRWLALAPDESLYSFLRLNFDELRRSHGGIVGTRLPRPKLVPLSSYESA